MTVPATPSRQPVPPRPAGLDGPPSDAESTWDELGSSREIRGHRMGRRAAKGGKAAKPIFVDRTGRRRRLVVAAGAAMAVLVALALAMLVAGLFGASPLPLPGLPELIKPAPMQPAPTTAHNPAVQHSPAGGSTTSATGNGNGNGNGNNPTTAGPSSSRRVPTQTPSKDRGKPTKT